MISKNFSDYQIFKNNVGSQQMSSQDFITFIPENDLGILSGYYETNDVVTLLRKHRFDPEMIQFIADMLEV